MKLKAEIRREFVLTLSISIKARVEAEPKERESVFGRQASEVKEVFVYLFN